MSELTTCLSNPNPICTATILRMIIAPQVFKTAYNHKEIMQWRSFNFEAKVRSPFCPAHTHTHTAPTQF